MKTSPGGMRASALAAALLLLPAPSPAATPATAGEDPVLHLERANRVEYLERDRRILLTGNVRLSFEENVILADEINIDLAAGSIDAVGHLVWQGEDHRAAGSRMHYDTKKREGWVEDVTLVTGPWICRGRRVDQSGQEKVEVQPGIITTCDNPSPHYHIYSKRIRIRPKRDLTAWQVTLYAGTTPVLWLPVLSTPLREFRLPFEAQVGKTQELGAYVRTSPSAQFAPNWPSQLHIDYFSLKGWGYGLTQGIDDGKGNRLVRIRGYQISERGAPEPGIPARRWELAGDGSLPLDPDTRVSGRVDLVSDAGFRELYGRYDSPASAVAGERRVSAMISRRLPGAHASVRVERTETRRLGYDGTARYVASEIYAPAASVSVIPVPVTNWLSASARMETERHYTWQNSWYVNSVSLVPGLEGYWRIPLLGSLTVMPRLPTTLRDRGDRVLRLDTYEFEEDVNHGWLFSGEDQASLRTPLIPGFLEMESTHVVAQRFNKIGYDPFNYNGLDAHRAGERLSAFLGRGILATLSTGYDLRNHQDPPKRRWEPVTPQVIMNPVDWLTLSADADYDIWYERWRRAAGTFGLGRQDSDLYLRVRPSYTNNRLELPQATRMSQEYRMAEHLYADSYQNALLYPEIFYVDAEVSSPLGPGIRGTLSGQYDMYTRRIQYYSVGISRDLHCWEVNGAFHHYISGELRFDASLNLKAFPCERVPLISL